MNKAEAIKKFKELYRQADYKTRRLIDKEIGKSITRNENEKQRKRAFFEAVKRGNLKAVETILERDKIIDVNQQDGKSGNTALTYAVDKEHYEVVKLLLQKGADPKIRNKHGYNSIDATRFCKDSRITDLLNHH